MSAGFGPALFSGGAPYVAELVQADDTANVGGNEPGKAKMSALQDSEMQRLSDLLAQGTLCNAREIARLLRVELGEQSDHTPKGESLRSYLALLAQITNRY